MELRSFMDGGYVKGIVCCQTRNRAVVNQGFTSDSVAKCLMFSDCEFDELSCFGC